MNLRNQLEEVWHSWLFIGLLWSIISLAWSHVFDQSLPSAELVDNWTAILSFGRVKSLILEGQKIPILPWGVWSQSSNLLGRYSASANMGQSISSDLDGSQGLTPSSLVLNLTRAFLRLFHSSSATEQQLALTQSTLTSEGTIMSADNNNSQATGLPLQRLNSIERKYPTTRDEIILNENMSDFKKTCLLVQKFLLNDNQLIGVRDALDKEMKKGLHADTCKDARGKPVLRGDNY